MEAPINWSAEVAECVGNLSRLIQAATVNPPGNEVPAVQVVKEILDKAGVPADNYTILESAEKRVNLVARLRGDGSQRPLLLSGHTDVVPVERDQWSRDPFGGEVVDGVVWGRGTLDMKGFLAMYLQMFLMLYRQKAQLKRDIILAAIADEEAGFTHGSRFLVDQHRSLIDAEYGLTEAGGMSLYMGNVKLYPIQVAEKGVCWLRVTTRGKPGHGSVPHSDNAVYHLALALQKLHRAGHLPVHITPTFQRMLESAGPNLPLPGRLLARTLTSSGLVGWLLGRVKGEPANFLRALTTNTVSPTMLKAGSKINVIPSTAEANLDCRLLPGQTPESVMAEIRAVTGKGLTLEPVYVNQGVEFSTETPLYRLLVKTASAMDSGGMVIPMLMPGATDASQYQRAGITMYGFTPGILPKDFPIMTLAHGHDERIPISFIESGLPVLWNVLQEFCG